MAASPAPTDDDDAWTLAQREEAGVMTLSTLPECVLAQIAAFGGLGGYRVVGACRGLAEVREACARAVARAVYSEALAKLDDHYASYAELLRDENSKNGMWCFDVDARIEWAANSRTSIHYVNRVSRVARGPSGELSVVVEAYGESDLRSAAPTVVYSVVEDANRRNAGVHTVHPSFVNELVKTPGHQFVVLHYAAGRWDRGRAIGYQYNGPNAHDYDPNLRFLEFNEQTLRDPFFWRAGIQPGRGLSHLDAAWRQQWANAFRGRGPLPEGVLRRVFVPLMPPSGRWLSAVPWQHLAPVMVPTQERAKYIPFATPTSPEDWGLPAPVLARWRAGTWGM